MLASTHIIAGVALASLMEGNLAAMAVTAVFAILPDIDTANSFFGRRVPIIPQLLKHRGVTHSLLMLVIEHGLTNHYFGPDWALYCTLGWASHIILDMCNPAGVQLFWPHSRKVGMPLIRTGSIWEFVLAVLIASVGIKINI
ncbi:MAG: metal-dependent hydrolase [bacterium]|nr:metal-dependent hydrolase [Bacillota bacterium]